MSKLVVSAWPLVWLQIGPDVCLEFWMDNSVTCNLLNDKAEHIEHTKKKVSSDNAWMVCGNRRGMLD